MSSTRNNCLEAKYGTPPRRAPSAHRRVPLYPGSEDGQSLARRAKGREAIPGLSVLLVGDRQLASLRDRTIVAVLAYSGPRPQEVVFRPAWEDIGERAIRYRDTKRHHVRFTPLLTPLEEDLREWFLASGRPGAKQPVFPAHDGGSWSDNDWRNWRSRIWRGEERPANRRNHPTYPGAAPAGARPRDLRSSFITLQVYAGVPLTTIAKQCGTSVTMIEKHYAGVIENWDGVQQPAVDQIRAARQAGGRSMDVSADSRDT